MVRQAANDVIADSATFLPRFQALRIYGAPSLLRLRITYNATAIRVMLTPAGPESAIPSSTPLAVGCSCDDVGRYMPAWQQFLDGLPSWSLLHAKGSQLLVFHNVSLELR